MAKRGRKGRSNPRRGRGVAPSTSSPVNSNPSAASSAARGSSIRRKRVIGTLLNPSRVLLSAKRSQTISNPLSPVRAIGKLVRSSAIRPEKPTPPVLPDRKPRRERLAEARLASKPLREKEQKDRDKQNNRPNCKPRPDGSKSKGGSRPFVPWC